MGAKTSVFETSPGSVSQDDHLRGRLTADDNESLRKDRLYPAANCFHTKMQEWLGHANIATTRMYDHRRTRPEDGPMFKVVYSELPS